MSDNPICQICRSSNIKEEGKPEFYRWATFVINGVQPLQVQKLICNDCGKIFGRIDINETLQSDVLIEVHNP